MPQVRKIQVPLLSRCGVYDRRQPLGGQDPSGVNRSEDKILLARHVGDEDYKLFAGYIRKGENAEKALVRELREETRLNAVK